MYGSVRTVVWQGWAGDRSPYAAYELLVGARRYRASKLAEKPSIPARIVNLSDSDARELQIIENLHRADIHELDEAFGYKALMEQNPDLYTVEVIGTKVGKSPAYVLGRLKLIELIPAVQKAFYEGKLSVGYALEIARLQSGDQERAFAECFPQHQNTSAVLKDRGAQATISVRDLRRWIQREIHLDLSTAPFDTDDLNLLPSAGACSACPKRTGNNPILFPDIKKRDTCMLCGICLSSVSFQGHRGVEYGLPISLFPSCRLAGLPGAKPC